MAHTTTVILLVAFLCLFHTSMAGDFTWGDCGVQLTKNINFVSASISPDPIGSSKTLSVNVNAVLTKRIYNADVSLTVVKDGIQYLDVDIQSLCSILSTTKSVSCPLPVGPVSFTYTFSSLPTLPSGKYDFYLRFYVADEEEGCVQLSGKVTGGLLADATTPGSKYQTSSFSATLNGQFQYEKSNPAQRITGDYIMAGGTFKGSLTSTPDLGGSVDLSPFRWTFNGKMVNQSQGASTAQVTHYYVGAFFVGSDAVTLLNGTFFLTYVYNSDASPTETISGTLIPTPRYTFSPNFTYPIVLGNLAPFQFSVQKDNSILVTGARQWCTVGTDVCGICGGDGSTCRRKAQNDDWPAPKLAAVIIGTVGGTLGIAAIVILAMLIKKERRIPAYDDADLLDHPQKPDYGTMAIDDIINEGERATF